MLKRMGELGLTGLTAPEEVGGLNQGAVVESAIIYELAQSPSVATSILDVQNMTAHILSSRGTDEQKDQYLNDAIAGEKLFAFSATDPAGSTNYSEWPDMGHIVGDEVILNGTKNFCSFAHPSDVITLVCKIDGKKEMVIVDKGIPGLTLGEPVVFLGGNSQNGMATLNFKDVHIPVSKILPPGVETVDLHFAMCYLNVATLSAGKAEGIYQKTKDYVLNRTRYSRPMGSFQAVAHKFAEMRTTLDVAQSFIYEAARFVDEGRGTVKKFYQAKLWIPDAAYQIINECITLWGGLGIDTETGLGKYLFDTRGHLMAERPSAIHRDMVASMEGFPVEFEWK
jgi:alkylation response protein AidB-like acyl-CoA dehydrogenase